MAKRIAFCGASGTGKTTLTKHVASLLSLPIDPVGSRSVAAEMGFASPYDVDAAGRRAEFQRRLVTAKVEWESVHDEFVTDRTTADNLAYLALHDVKAINSELFKLTRRGLSRYTHIFYCPVDAFCSTGDDPARVHDMAYQRVFDAALLGLLLRTRTSFVPVKKHGLDARKALVEHFLTKW